MFQVLADLGAELHPASTTVLNKANQNTSDNFFMVNISMYIKRGMTCLKRLCIYMYVNIYSSASTASNESTSRLVVSILSPFSMTRASTDLCRHMSIANHKKMSKIAIAFLNRPFGSAARLSLEMIALPPYATALSIITNHNIYNSICTIPTKKLAGKIVLTSTANVGLHVLNTGQSMTPSMISHLSHVLLFA